MAEYVQQRAGEMTAEKAAHALEERGGASVEATATIWVQIEEVESEHRNDASPG